MMNRASPAPIFGRAPKDSRLQDRIRRNCRIAVAVLALGWFFLSLGMALWTLDGRMCRTSDDGRRSADLSRPAPSRR